MNINASVYIWAEFHTDCMDAFQTIPLTSADHLMGEFKGSSNCSEFIKVKAQKFQLMMVGITGIAPFLKYTLKVSSKELFDSFIYTFL